MFKKFSKKTPSDKRSRFLTRRTKFLLVGVLLASTLFLIVLAASPVTDTFTDTTKIATSTNITVDTVAGQVKLSVIPWTCGDALVDSRDSKSYTTVLIGSQCWTAENMQTTKYPDGSSITKGPSAHGAAGWTTDEGYYSCPPNSSNDGEDCAAAATLGMLYQWSAAMNGAASSNAEPSGVQGICPSGWHIPSHYEWVTLERQICSDIGNASCDTTFPKDESTTGWLGQDTTTAEGEGSAMAGNEPLWTNGDIDNSGAGNNDFGTSGLDIPPSGIRDIDGSYLGRSYRGYLWSSFGPSTAWYRALLYNQSGVYRTNGSRASGFPVRCVRD